MESIVLDDLDLRLVNALAIDGRASFSRIAAVLEVSDQTVARRYRRLRRAGVVRIIGRLDASRLGQVAWALRLKVTPGAVGAIAQALAKRPDTSWVQVASGGTEVVCGTRADSEQDHDQLLGQLTETRQILAISAQCVLHTFRGGRTAWPALTGALTPDEARQLELESGVEGAVELNDADRTLLDALGEDGRASHASLAQTTGWHEATVRRRIETLRAAGALFIDVDIDERLLGFRANTVLWMSVAPAQLSAVGQELATHPQVAFAGAISGQTNLFASVMCRDVYGLYDYLTNQLAARPGIAGVETMPIVRTVKRGSVLGRPMGGSPNSRN
ncbi:Lrp/AsnC family transcriptional regulator [Kribbella soli]